jgi:hypothetical protein
MRAYYIKHCRILIRIIEGAKRKHYCRFITKLDNLIKITWNIIKHETAKLRLTEQIPSLLINDEAVKDPEVIPDAFNTFFLKTAENLNLHQEVRGDAISSLKEAFPRNFSGVNIISTTETEIKSIIHSLKAKNT